MKFRSISLLAAVAAVVAGVLVAAPAQAASHYAVVTSKAVAISSAGNGKVYLKCLARSTCRGKISLSGSTVKKAYAVKGRSAKYVKVAVRKTDTAYPFNGKNAGDYRYKSGVKIFVDEDKPRNKTHYYVATTQTPVHLQQIAGRVFLHGAAGSEMRVSLYVIKRGGNTQQITETAALGNGGRYSFNVALGANNSPAGPYEVRITGKDQNGQFRSWWWRGRSGVPLGGGKYIREATKVVAGPARNYTADFHLGTLTGHVNTGGAEITVAAAPGVYSRSATQNRELDIPNCANIMGQTTTNSNGNYRVGFLPVAYGRTDRRYMVQADKGSSLKPLWNDQWGSCASTMNYGRSVANLLSISRTGVSAKNLTLRAINNTLKVDAGFSGFTPTVNGDRFVRIREKVPGVKVLNAPVIASKTANAAGVVSFGNLPRGRYWVEVGRRTGCTDWYPSRFTNNYAYLSGLDRYAEGWKSFSRLSKLKGNSKHGLEGIAVRHGATYKQQNHSSGSRGWMYREHCKAVGAGTYQTVAFSTSNGTHVVSARPKVKRGGVVVGHVSRAAGKTNKEIMVRLSSSQGVRVLRTAMTNGSGNFTVQGLASGRYTISVNSDSWRGIGRSFTGKHSIRVHAGHKYRAGTLRFKG